jgi:hypothetical protein
MELTAAVALAAGFDQGSRAFQQKSAGGYFAGMMRKASCTWPARSGNCRRRNGANGTPFAKGWLN